MASLCIFSESSAEFSGVRVWNHQANDKVLPDIYTFHWLACNKTEISALPAIAVLQSAKNRSSDHVQNGQNFGLALNIGPAFSDCFPVLTAI